MTMGDDGVGTEGIGNQKGRIDDGDGALVPLIRHRPTQASQELRSDGVGEDLARRAISIRGESR